MCQKPGTGSIDKRRAVMAGINGVGEIHLFPNGGYFKGALYDRKSSPLHQRKIVCQKREPQDTGLPGRLEEGPIKRVPMKPGTNAKKSPSTIIFSRGLLAGSCTFVAAAHHSFLNSDLNPTPTPLRRKRASAVP